MSNEELIDGVQELVSLFADDIDHDKLTKALQHLGFSDEEIQDPDKLVGAISRKYRDGSWVPVVRESLNCHGLPVPAFMLKVAWYFRCFNEWVDEEETHLMNIKLAELSMGVAKASNTLVVH